MVRNQQQIAVDTRQVIATIPTLRLIDTLRAPRTGAVPPVRRLLRRFLADVFPTDDFIVGDHDVRLGEIGGAALYISAPQFGYWKHTQLIIDVVPGRGGMFSLENGEGVRFLVRSRLFTDEEFEALKVQGKV